MADPIRKPQVWSKTYPTYAEKHNMYSVFQELLKELIVTKPVDPLEYIRDEVTNVARLLYAPRAFLVGPNVVTQGIGMNMATQCGAKFLTLVEIIESAPSSIRNVLMSVVQESGQRLDESVQKLLVSTIRCRLTKPDCQKNGYILYGFPQNGAQAKAAQQNGLLPRQVYVLLADSSAPSLSNAKSVPNTQSNRSQASLSDMDGSLLREVVDAYDSHICKAIPYEKWSSTKKQDVEGELLVNLVSMKPTGSPWIPKVLILGPPCSGKSMVAEEICKKYSFVNVDFIELIRGTSILEDDMGAACKKYLTDLQPMNDDLMKKLIKRRINQNDCERKGWVLHGFPDVARQLQILESLQVIPNRVFLLSCPEPVCSTRLQQKRNEVMNRQLSSGAGASDVDESNFAKFPFGKQSFQTRFNTFSSNLADISNYFGSKAIYVDASQKAENVIKFVEDAVLRPPVVRFPKPS